MSEGGKGETGEEFGVGASGPHIHPLTWGDSRGGDRRREIRTIRKNPGVRRRRHTMDKRKDKRLPGEAVKEPCRGGREKQGKERGTGQRAEGAGEACAVCVRVCGVHARVCVWCARPLCSGCCDTTHPVSPRQH